MNAIRKVSILPFSFLLLVTVVAQIPSSKIERNYDSLKKITTVRLTPVQIAADQGKYHSLHISPSFKYPSEIFAKPDIIDFELQTVVKGRLDTDLYVVFIIDGETVFLSSSRWGIKRPVPGRVWMGERLVFRMRYETLVRLSTAKKAAIKMDGISFEFSDEHKSLLNLAEGRYIARMDADDVSLPVRLERQVGFLEQHAGVGILGTGFRHCFASGRDGDDQGVPATHELIRWALCFHNCLCHPSVMMRRDTIAQLGFYSPEFAHARTTTSGSAQSRPWRRPTCRNPCSGIVSPRRGSKTHTEAQSAAHLRLMKIMIERVLARSVPLDEIAALRCIETHAWERDFERVAAAERLLGELHRGFSLRTKLSALERAWLAADVRLKRGILLADGFRIDPLRVAARPWWAWRSVTVGGIVRLSRRAVQRVLRSLRARARAADELLFRGAVRQLLYRPAKDLIRAVSSGRRANGSRGTGGRVGQDAADGNGSSRAPAFGSGRVSWPQGNGPRRVVIWGHPLHSHTHSYIHAGFARAFEYLGFEVLWVSGSRRPAATFSTASS